MGGIKNISDAQKYFLDVAGYHRIIHQIGYFYLPTATATGYRNVPID